MTKADLTARLAVTFNLTNQSDINIVEATLDYFTTNQHTFAELDYLHRMQQPLKGITPVALHDYAKIWHINNFKTATFPNGYLQGFGFYAIEMQPDESIFKFLNTQIVFLPTDLDKGITNNAEYIIWYPY